VIPLQLCHVIGARIPKNEWLRHGGAHFPRFEGCLIDVL